MRHTPSSKRLLLALAGIAAVGLFGLDQIGDRLSPADAASVRIEIWHGAQQKVGHLGDAQGDFNLMGRVDDPQELLSLQYTLNASIPVELNFHAYRRLAMDGDFNADIPIAALAPGRNTVQVEARFSDGVAGQTVTIERLSGASSLPFHIDWSAVSDPQEVGQYVDGHWRLGEHGLRPAHLGYDRLFLIGDETWQDYEITAAVTIHEVTPETGPLSGGNGLGFIMRFTGHVVGGPRRFPIAQPKWGYQPVGAITWLRWISGQPDGAAFEQFLSGDSNDKSNYRKVEIRHGETYVLRARCQTLRDADQGHGVTRYAFKLWPAAADEPQAWDWKHVQTSRDALRRGGVALVAHHVDASFGNISVVPLAIEPPQS
jgi:hypothetical protein